jgi:hypothetical protein
MGGFDIDLCKPAGLVYNILNYKDINSMKNTAAMKPPRLQLATRRQVTTQYIRHGLFWSERLRQSKE